MRKSIPRLESPAQRDNTREAGTKQVTAEPGTVMVLGAAGMLGLALCHQFRQRGYAVLPVMRRQFDILQHPVSDLQVGGLRAVVNAAGLINRRVSELPPEAFWRVNAVFPRQLADHCERAGTALIHVSTDCVFSGHGAPHDELARCDAADLYGASKAAGEPLNARVIRTSIIGPEAGRASSLMCWFLQQRDEVPGYTHHLWNGVTTLELARVLCEMLDTQADRAWGVRHVFGQDITKHDLLLLMAEVLGHRVRILPRQTGPAKDMRLKTCHPDELRRWEVQPLARQLEELRPLCGPQGRWMGGTPDQLIGSEGGRT